MVLPQVAVVAALAVVALVEVAVQVVDGEWRVAMSRVHCANRVARGGKTQIKNQAETLQTKKTNNKLHIKRT